MNRKNDLALVMAVVLAVAFVTACGKSSSPTSPSPSLASSARSGASITGTVSGTTGASGAGYGALDTGGGITVTITGTGLTVAVDAGGKFVFTGVPAGTVELVFTSSGGTATITLPNVKETDTITIKVTIKGTSAELDTEERNGTPMTEIEDRITAINPPGATANTLMVGDRQVSVPTAAIIRHGGTTLTFSDLKVGDRVHVRGQMGTTTFTATEVNLQNGNEKVPVNASGTVSGVSGSCKTIRFTVGGWLVETNNSTDFQKNSCPSIVDGTVKSVHVKGDVQDSGRVLATWVQPK
jgi:hypothetical protein